MTTKLHILTGYSNAACPDGWLHNGSSCYVFSTDEFAWQTAQMRNDL